MELKRAGFTFTQANQDIGKSKFSPEVYYEAGHIRLTTAGGTSTGNITNERGNTLRVELPEVSIDSKRKKIIHTRGVVSFKGKINNEDSEITKLGDVEIKDSKIIGDVSTRDGIVLFTTSEKTDIDIIYYIDSYRVSSYRINLIFIGKLGFSIDNPIHAIYNYENENIQKVYWVDGKNQIRFINIKHDEIEGNSKLIDQHPSTLDFMAGFNMSHPEIKSVKSGGNHTAGVIQYAYSLYNLNGGETNISPLTDLVPLSKNINKGGGDVNEMVGSAPEILIKNTDYRYDYIRIYAIKYTSNGQLPSISLIYDESFTPGADVTYIDYGSIIETMSLESFLFTGSNVVVPKYITSKDNRLFISNIKESSFTIPKGLDVRCYSYSKAGTAYIINNQEVINRGIIQDLTYTPPTIKVPSNYSVSPTSSATNSDYSTQKYDKEGNYGGEGKYFKYNIVQKTKQQLSPDKVEDLKFFKDGDIYRIGIVFYNNLGQKSLPYWMADFIAPEGNLDGRYNTLEITPKPELLSFLGNYNWENENDKPVGYYIVRAERRRSDRLILYSGIISDFIVQAKLGETSPDGIESKFNDYEDSNQKVPTWLIRHYDTYPQANSNYSEVKGGLVTGTDHGGYARSEIYTEGSRDYRRQFTWKYNKMMQLHSPEIMFSEEAINIPSGLSFRPKALMGADLNKTYYWGQLIHVDTKLPVLTGKRQGTLSPQPVAIGQQSERAGVLESTGPDGGILKMHTKPRYNPNHFGNHAFIMTSPWSDSMYHDQYYREYTTVKTSSDLVIPPIKYKIYGNPEFSVRGHGLKYYNNDPRYEYTNSLESIMSDRHSRGDDNTRTSILNVNSYANNSLTFMLGGDNDSTSRRTGLKTLQAQMQPNASQKHNTVLYGEIVRDVDPTTATDIYGGNSYEAKKRTRYLKIGESVSIRYGSFISISKYVNNSPGDTYVQDYKFSRITKTDKEVYDVESIQISEILSFPTETTIDLKNRNDTSVGPWDSMWQPRTEDFHKYNNVYSQESTIEAEYDVEHTFRRVNNFDTRIQASRLKIPSESVDSWTRFPENEYIDLKGDYGSINSLQLFNDDMFSFQDKAIAGIQVNPRVQIATEDGVGLELGTGEVLSSFKYLTTSSGSINHSGITVGKRGIYYYDALNKGVGRIPNETSYLLSEAKGLKSFFNKTHNLEAMKVNNPLLYNGAIFATDLVNNDIYMTIMSTDENILLPNDAGGILKPGTGGFQPAIPKEVVAPNKDSFTWVFNEATDSFIDLKSYLPTRYIHRDNKLLLTIDNKKIYEQNTGEYNNFFGEYQPSYITLLLNPDVNVDKVFTNILYNSEVTLDDIDQPEKTLTHIHAWNEYQNTGKIPLVVGRNKNIRRKFRNWNADIPRDGRNRIRNPWVFLKLEFENEEGYRLVLHDIVVTYMI